MLSFAFKACRVVIVGAAILFFFCLDVLGGAFIHFGTRKEEVGESKAP